MLERSVVVLAEDFADIDVFGIEHDEFVAVV